MDKYWDVYVNKISTIPLYRVKEEIDLLEPVFKTKRVYYDPSIVDVLIGKILKQIDKLNGNLFKPKFLVVDVEKYEKICAHVSFISDSPILIKPKEIFGLKIIVMPGEHCKVLTSKKDEFLYREKLEEIRKEG